MSKASKKSFKSTRAARRGAIARVRGSERLEVRSLMAGNVANPWHNDAFPADVDGDRVFAPLDALVIINSLNTQGSRQLFDPTAVASGNGNAGGGDIVGGAEAEAPTYRYDVNNDGWIAPLDALRLINALNGEGEAGDVVAFRVKVTNLDGTALPLQGGKPRLSVGQSVLVQMTTEDLRIASVDGQGNPVNAPDGVFAAYADLAFGINLEYQRRETQLIRFSSAPAPPTGSPSGTPSGTFTLTVTVPNLDTGTGTITRTTGPINFVRETTGETTRNNIIAALSAPSMGLFRPGEVIGEIPRPLTTSKQTNFGVKFGGRYANRDIPEMTGTWTSGGTAPTITVIQYNQLSTITTPPPLVPEEYMSLTYPTYANAITTLEIGDKDVDTGVVVDPNVLSEAGGVGEIGGVLDGEEYVVFAAQFKVLSPGSFSITTNPADSGKSVEVLVYGSNVAVPTSAVDYGFIDVVAVRAVEAADDTATVNEDSLASNVANRINVLLNDTLNQGGTKRITSFNTSTANGGTVTRFDNGTTTNPSDDQLIYAPAANFAGTDTFTYEFGDGNGNTATATVTVTVTAVNDAPVNTVPGSQTTAEDTVRTFSTANNNAFSVTDVDAANGTIRVTFTSSNGTLGLTNATGVTASGNGASGTPLVITGTVASINTALGLGLNYTPTANFSGSGSIVMVTTDQGNTGGNALTDTDTVNITITAVNDPPVNTLPATLATDEGVAFTITGLSIADVDAGTAQIRTTLSVTANTGNLQLLNTTGVTVTTNNSASVQIAGSLAAINTALNGGVRFTPAAGFAGDTQFTMLTTDQGNTGAGGAQTDSDNQTLQVRPLVRPRASSDSLTVVEDSSAAGNTNQINVFTNDVPNPNATLILKSFTQPANGTVTQIEDTGTLQFVPAANFAGTTTFTYTINDSAGTGADSTATVTVTVTAVNDAPTAVGDAASVAEDTVGTFTAASLTANDLKGGGADENSQTLTIVAATVVSGGGTVQVTNGNVVYTPAPNYAGPATLTYTIRDNGLTNGANDFKEATGTITVTVTEVNDAPTAVNDSGFTVAEDPVSVFLSIPLADLVANDLGGGGADEAGQTLTITSVTGVTANAGAVVISGTNAQYTPAADYNGPFVFTYVVTDNGTTNGTADPKTATGTVTVTVTEVNDAPTATNDTVIGVLSTPTNYTSFQLTANDLRGPANEFGQSLKVTAVTSPSANGATVSVDANGVVTYTPASGAISGTSDTFTYTVSDNGTTNGSADPKTATGTVTVNIVNFRPMTVSGFVYLDFDNDGVKDSGEVGMGHIDVTLSGTDFAGTVITPQTIITNREGFYEFTNLAPGNYTITQGQAANSVDGLETSGSPRLTSSANDRFSFNVTLDENVQLQNTSFTNNNFAERGLSSSFVSIHLLIVPGVPSVPGTSDLPEGLLFSFSDSNATTLDWYAIEDGWTGVNYSGVTLSGDRMSATVRVINAAGQTVQTTATVASGRLRVQQDASGKAVAYIIGSYDDFNWSPVAQSGGSGEAEGEGGEGEAQLVAEAMAGGSDAEYAAAIDAALGEVWG